MSSARPDAGDRVPAAEAVVGAALHAFESQEWDTLVALTDAASLETMRTGYLEMRRQMPPFLPPLDIGDMYKPEFREEAEKEFRAIFENRREFGELAGVMSLAEAEALDSAEFLRRWAQARHPEYLFDGKVPWYHDGKLKRRVVVGSIATLPDTVAVMVRETEGVIEVHAHEFIAVLGDNRGGWLLDAEDWLGLGGLQY